NECGADEKTAETPSNGHGIGLLKEEDRPGAEDESHGDRSLEIQPARRAHSSVRGREMAFDLGTRVAEECATCLERDFLGIRHVFSGRRAVIADPAEWVGRTLLPASLVGGDFADPISLRLGEDSRLAVHPRALVGAHWYTWPSLRSRSPTTSTCRSTVSSSGAWTGRTSGTTADCIASSTVEKCGSHRHGTVWTWSRSMTESNRWYESSSRSRWSSGRSMPLRRAIPCWPKRCAGFPATARRSRRILSRRWCPPSPRSRCHFIRPSRSAAVSSNVSV